jgi:hypothetical protein
MIVVRAPSVAAEIVVGKHAYHLPIFGSIEAGYRAAILLTIISTAHRHHLDVWVYVKDVLDRSLAGERDLESLQADRRAQSHPEAIRQYRVAEARYRADAKAFRGARRRLAAQPDGLKPSG